MSWFFSSKKSNSRSDLYVKEEDGFSVVTTSTPEQKLVTPYSLYPTVQSPLRPGRPPPPRPWYPPYTQETSCYPPPYPPVSGPLPLQTSTISTNISSQSQHPLDSIPFKLSSTLESTSSPMTKYQLNSIKKQLDEITEEINSGAFRYDFKLEKSILQEERLLSREH